MNRYDWIGFVGCLIALAGVVASPISATADQPLPQHASYTVTRTDDGRTLTMNVGDGFLLKLGDDFNWTITSGRQPIVRRVPNVLVVRGAQGLYTVERPGETDITATGTPNCAPDQPCIQLLATFRVHISVAGALKYRVTLPLLADDDGGTHAFVVSGTVLAGPTCPVQRIPPDPACADRPVGGAEILVTNDAGDQVGDLVTDAEGKFSIALQPGSYTLRPQAVRGLLGTAALQTLQVAGRDVQVTVHYDTGIR